MGRAFLTLFLAVFLLITYQFVHERIPFLRNNFVQVNFFSSIMDKKAAKALVQGNIEEAEKASILAEKKQEVEALAVENSDSILESEGEVLGKFFKALMEAQAGNGQCRIAYFGDSMIEGDLITQTLRNSLQVRFGGQGVGYVPIVSGVAGFRRTIIHDFAKGIRYYSLITGRPKAFALGYNGEVCVASGDSSNPYLYYAASKLYPAISALPRTRLFYANSFKDSLSSNRVLVDGKAFDLNGRDTINSIWLSSTSRKSIRMKFELGSQIGLYGVSFESETGVILDNLGMRGTSGMNLTMIPGSILRGYNRELHPNLVILQYGLNMVQRDRTNYDSYRTHLEKVIRHFQANFPDAAILVIGIADKAGKIDGEMGTEPAVLLISEAQRKAAENTGVAFFSLFDAMGGEGSMIRWVEQEKPAWANLDYTHVNHIGAAKIATYIRDYLLKGYEKYSGMPAPQPKKAEPAP